VTVAEVLAESPVAVAEPAVSAVAGSVVPTRTAGMTATVLPPDYQQGASALRLGLAFVPATATGGGGCGPPRHDTACRRG
jgi:hypothetical protein